MSDTPRIRPQCLWIAVILPWQVCVMVKAMSMALTYIQGLKCPVVKIQSHKLYKCTDYTFLSSNKIRVQALWCIRPCQSVHRETLFPYDSFIISLFIAYPIVICLCYPYLIIPIPNLQSLYLSIVLMQCVQPIYNNNIMIDRINVPLNMSFNPLCTCAPILHCLLNQCHYLH